MEQPEYPKIETLYNRDPQTFKVVTDQLRWPEFSLVNEWYVTEKIDGTNVRIFWDADHDTVTFGGRTDKAQMPTSLVTYLQAKFQPKLFSEFTGNAILYGEGYGLGIQKGGKYRADAGFRLFDVLVGRWWLGTEDIQDVAAKMNILTVPHLITTVSLPQDLQDLSWLLGHESGDFGSGNSTVAQEDAANSVQAEGVVARTEPLLFTRSGHRLMWKLKFRDFE